MGRHLLTAGLIYLSLASQSSLAGELSLSHSQPWFPGIMLVFCVMLHPGSAGLMWGALLGLGVDCLSNERLGVQVILVTIVGLMLRSCTREGATFGSLRTGVLIFLATLCWKGLSATTLGLLENQKFHSGWWLKACKDGVYSALLVTSVLLFMNLLKNGIKRRDQTCRTVLTNQWSMLSP